MTPPFPETNPYPSHPLPAFNHPIRTPESPGWAVVPSVPKERNRSAAAQSQGEGKMLVTLILLGSL